MATARRNRKEDYMCSACGKSVESWSRESQDAHEEMHKREREEDSKQMRLS